MKPVLPLYDIPCCPSIKGEFGTSGMIYSMDLVCEGEEEYLDGSPEREELFMRMIEALRLNPDHLID